MLQRIKVGKIKLKYWWSLFILFQLLLISLMLSSLFISSWVYSNSSNYYKIENSQNETIYSVDLSSFKGSISKCTRGCFDSSQYSSLKLSWCNLDQYNQTSSNSDICDMFTNLSEAGKISMIFEAVSIVQVFLWAFTMMLFVRKVKYFGMSYCTSVCGLIAHLISLSAWFSLTHASATSCAGSGPVGLCMSSGPALQIAALLIYPAGLAAYYAVACKAYQRRTDSTRVNPATARQPLARLPIPVFPAKILNPEAVFNPIAIDENAADGLGGFPYPRNLAGHLDNHRDADRGSTLPQGSLEANRSPSPFKIADRVEHSEIILAMPPAVNAEEDRQGEAERFMDG